MIERTPEIGRPLAVTLTGAQRFVLEALADSLSAHGVAAVWCSPDLIEQAPPTDVWIIESGEGTTGLLDRIRQRSSVRCYLLDLGSFGAGVDMVISAGRLSSDMALADLVALLACSSAPEAVSSNAIVRQLSAREIQVLSEVASGASQKAIADLLSLSPQTVRTHLQNAMAKLGAHSRGEAVAFARQAGWLRHDPRTDCAE